MNKVYVIGTMKDFPKENLREIYGILKESFPNLKGMKIAYGPGCLNVGLCGLREEQVKTLCFHLMPAKYAEALDEPWEGLIDMREGEFS